MLKRIKFYSFIFDFIIFLRGKGKEKQLKVT